MRQVTFLAQRFQFGVELFKLLSGLFQLMAFCALQELDFFFQLRHTRLESGDFFFLPLPAPFIIRTLPLALAVQPTLGRTEELIQ
ncbi:hypothetical protein, partial [uncultured Desulfovibrio sp.]|uniref:hypothetical protein n=1 Tax=uncultured Desulfovibrio sp. TaxID=167968 RepID=UPI00272A04D1